MYANSLIIHEVIAKEIIIVTVVWILYFISPFTL